MGWQWSGHWSELVLVAGGGRRRPGTDGSGQRESCLYTSRSRVLAALRWNSTVGGCQLAPPYRRSCRSFFHLLFNQRPDEEEEEEEAVGGARSATDAVKIKAPLPATEAETTDGSRVTNLAETKGYTSNRRK